MIAFLSAIASNEIDIWVPQQAGWLGSCRNLVVKLFRIGSLHWVCQPTIVWRLVGYTKLQTTNCRRARLVEICGLFKVPKCTS